MVTRRSRAATDSPAEAAAQEPLAKRARGRQPAGATPAVDAINAEPANRSAAKAKKPQSPGGPTSDAALGLSPDDGAEAGAQIVHEEEDDGLTEYEREQRLQIQRNRERMAALQLPGLASQLAALKPAKANGPSQRGVKKQKTPSDAPRRQSSRLQGQMAEGALAEGVDFERRDGSVVLKAGAAPAAAAAARPPSRIEGPVPFESSNGEGGSDAAFLALLKAATCDSEGAASARLPCCTADIPLSGRSALGAAAFAKLKLVEGDVAKVTQVGAREVEEEGEGRGAAALRGSWQLWGEGRGWPPCI